MLWTAHSRELKALQEARIGLDKHEHLSLLVSQGRQENQMLRRLSEALPAAADRLCSLSDRLSAAQDYLKVEGGIKADASQRQAIHDAVREAAEAFKVSNDDDDEKSVSDALSGVRLASSSIASCQRECGRLLDLVSDEEVRAASLQLDSKRREVEDLMQLEMPEPVPLPKLVDI